MTLQIQAVKLHAVTPAEDMAGKKLIARKSGHAHVAGNVYKVRHRWVRLCEFVGASRGPSVMGKAYFESRHYVQAAIARKTYSVHQQELQSGREFTPHEFKNAVWNSNGVQNRMMREDLIRFNGKHYCKAAGASKNNRKAYKSSRVAHGFHGVCEMFAAPTGMTTNLLRNTALKKPDEQSTRNKAFMLGSLGFIGVATTELISWLKKYVPESLKIGGEHAGGALVAFPAISSTMGSLGSLFGLRSQFYAEKQEFSEQQIDMLELDLNTTLQKLVHRLKSVQNRPDLIKMMGQAMHGKRGLLSKIGKDGLAADGIPKILKSAVSNINQNASDTDNMKALFDVAGEYLQVPNKPDPKNSSLWSRYIYTKRVKEKERHWVALLGLVEHVEVSAASKDTVDMRKNLEDKLVPQFHTWILKKMIPVAKGFDRTFETSMARRFEKWTSPAHLKAQATKANNPLFRSKYAYSGSYMAKHRHQYGPVTRCLITLAEGIRLFNMNIVLASNANLSRVFNNLAQTAHELLGTSPASRTMCNSIGRFFGGAVLAVIFGVAIPMAVTESGGSSTYDFGVGTSEPVTLSATNIGILMCILAAPTLLAQGLAHLSARLEGWRGDSSDSVSSNEKSFRW